MKIDLTKKYITRGGLEVTGLKVNSEVGPGELPLEGMVETLGKCYWYADGKTSPWPTKTFDGDLIEVEEDQYADGKTSHYPMKTFNGDLIEVEEDWYADYRKEAEAGKFKPKITRTGYINIYPDGVIQTVLYWTRKHADELAAFTRVACVKINIEYTEGQYDA